MNAEEKALEELSKLENLSSGEKAEYERIQTEIEKCEKAISLLEQGRKATYQARNYRYVLDLDVPFENLPVDGLGNPTGTPLSFGTSTTIKKDTKFFCTHMECSTYAVGVFQGTQLTLAIRPWLRREYLQFEWAVRDTGSDRSWQNDFLPMGMLKTNRVNSLELGTPTVLSGGSEVFLEYKVKSMALPIIDSLFEEIKKYTIQTSFCGYEVSEK